MSVDSLASRISRALKVADECGGYDGSHHKIWVIDQMVRELTGCPLEKRSAIGYNGAQYEYEELGESQEYINFVKNHENGENGPHTYAWDEGIAP